MKNLPLMTNRLFLSKEKRRRNLSCLIVFLLLIVLMSPSMAFAENLEDNDIEVLPEPLAEYIDNDTEVLPETIAEYIDNDTEILPEALVEYIDDETEILVDSFIPEETPEKTELLPISLVTNKKDSDRFEIQNITYYINRFVDGNPYGEPIAVSRGERMSELLDPDPEYWPENAVSFIGWFCSHCDLLFPAQYPIFETWNIYAKFEIKEPQQYAVVYWDGYETKSPIQENLNVPEGEPLPQFVNEEKLTVPSGENFSGDWMIYEEGTPLEDLARISQVDFSNYNVESNLILIPVFIKDEEEALPPEDEDLPEFPITGNPPATENPPETESPPETGNPPETEAPTQPETGKPISEITNTESTRVATNTPTNQINSTIVIEEIEVASLIDEPVKTIMPSLTPLYPNHEVKLSPIFPPLTTGDNTAGFNFALTGATIALMILLFITYFTKGKEDFGRVNKHGLLRLLSIAPSIASIILLVPTQDLSMPLRMADSFTLHHAAILLMQLLLVLFARKSYSYDSLEEIG